MADPRFFIDGDLVANTTVDLPPRAAHHAAHVLRLREGDQVVVFNGRGGEYAGLLGARGSRVELSTHDPVERESPLQLALVQAWIATDKLEWVVEKAVELGAARIVLMPARRSVVQIAGPRLAKRLERLRDVVIAACCQCGRNRVPTIAAFDDPRSALGDARGKGAALVLDPGSTRSLVEAASSATAFAVAVGPEGGFDAGELTLAQETGYQPVRIGSRILRTETAGLAALAALQAAAGDFR